MFFKPSFPVNVSYRALRILRLRKLILIAAIVTGSLALLHFPRPASAANRTWDGGGATNNWSEAANWSGDTVPDSSGIAVFDGTSTKNAIIDVSINVGGIEIDSGYTGTISQSAGVDITISNSGSYSQADGTFNGGNGNLSIQFSFFLSGGTFNAPTGTLSVGFNFTHSGGTFNHNSGIVAWINGSGTVDVPTSDTFNNLSWNLPDGTSRSIPVGDTLIVLGNLALNDGAIGGGGTVEARAGVTVGANFDGVPFGSPTLLITPGDGNPRTLTFNAGAKLPNLNLNAANVTINTAGVGTIDFQFGSLTLQAGTIQQGSVGLIVKGYSQSGGTFTGGSGSLTVADPGGGGNFTLSAGTFTGGSGDIDVRGIFSISGGTFTSTPGILSVGSFTHSAGTFNHNSGTVAFTGSGPTINIAAPSETFNNVAFNMTAGFGFAIPGGKTLIATGNLAFNTGRLDGNGTIEARANVTVGLNFSGPGFGSPTILFSGAANQIFTNNGGVNPQGTWIVNKTSGRLTLASNLILNNGQSLNITSGILDQGTSFDLTTGPTTTIASAGRLNNQGTGDLTLGGNIQNDGTISLNGGGGGCTDADSILIRSTINGTQRHWSGSGNFFLTDVDVKDQIADNPPGNINVYQGTDSGNNTNFSFLSGCNPTAANGTISGRIVDERGNPVAGVVVRLSGTQNRKFITDSDGFYRFKNVETNGFYTLSPARANYNFNPFNRSFSQVGNQTEASFIGTSLGDNLNPLDTPEYFVRQQYLDILGREPDEVGFNYWSDHILHCGGDVECTRAERTSVAAAFFIEQEFRQSGAFIYNVYSGALGRRPAYAEYSADRKNVIGGATLETQKQAFAEAFVARAEFVNRYQNNTTAESFVDALLANVQQTLGVDLSDQRRSLIESYNAGTSQAESRTLVLRAVTESATVRDANYNAAFVGVEYFGYLHRNPDQQGYDFWLNVLNTGDPGNYRGMVCSFITSTEYQRRFSGIVSHSNGECGN